jgi:hypothetical protein
MTRSNIPADIDGDPIVATIADMGFITDSGELSGCRRISRSTGLRIVNIPVFYYVSMLFRHSDPNLPRSRDYCAGDYNVRGYITGLCNADYDDDDDDLFDASSHHHHGGSSISSSGVVGSAGASSSRGAERAYVLSASDQYRMSDAYEKMHNRGF